MSHALSPILSRYIGWRFLQAFLVVYGGLLGLIYLIDSIEMIRGLAKYGNLALGRTLVMTALKLPKIGLDLMPFAMLIAAVFTFWRLTRTSELVVVRATGVSAWQFLLAPVIAGILVAVLKMAVLNPLGAVMLNRYEHMEAHYLSSSQNIVNIARSGLWLRQQISPTESAIIHASNIQLPQWILSPVTAFFFDGDYIQTFRIDSAKARLTKGEWIFDEAWINKMSAQGQNEVTHKPVFYNRLRLPTRITSQDIISRFTSPETIPFWSLPEHARIMQSTGFESNPLWAHFYGLLAEPVLNTALIIIAAALALRAPRMQRNWYLVISTLAVGFFIFFLGDLLEALGISDKLPLVVAVFVPAVLSLFAGLTALLYLEDG